jgi:hypothetical protein
MKPPCARMHIQRLLQGRTDKKRGRVRLGSMEETIRGGDYDGIRILARGRVGWGMYDDTILLPPRPKRRPMRYLLYLPTRDFLGFSNRDRGGLSSSHSFRSYSLWHMFTAACILPGSRSPVAHRARVFPLYVLHHGAAAVGHRLNHP